MSGIDLAGILQTGLERFGPMAVQTALPYAQKNPYVQIANQLATKIQSTTPKKQNIMKKQEDMFGGNLI